jgi:putative Holliday junction resolvase
MNGSPPQVRTGVRIGIDVGTVRIGVARSDAAGVLALPVETIDRRRGDDDALRRISALVADFEAIEVLVGHPIALSGRAGAAAGAAEGFARQLADLLPDISVRLIDERLTTVTAQRNLHAAGRTHRNSRSVIDQEAAVIVVQQALDSERASGAPTGTAVRRHGG